MLDLIGWLGAICFALCALPQAVACYKQGHAEGIDDKFLWLWVIGEVCMIIYTIFKVKDLPLLLNYIANLTCLVIIVRYRYFPVKIN